MKLLMCPKCSTVRSIRLERTTCDCGQVVAQYDPNRLTCKWNGQGELLGFTNSSFIGALREQRFSGDRKDGLGYTFTAFVIPHSAQSIVIDTTI
jgi:hypothetical protein